MSFEDRQLLLDEDAAMVDLNVDYDSDSDSGFQHPPPGEEGILMSHAGGEDKVLEDMLSQFQPKQYVACPLQFNLSTFIISKRVDLRTRKDRIEVRTKAWKDQLPSLTTAYLQWKHQGGVVPDPLEGIPSWEITVVDFFSKLFEHLKLTLTQFLD
jgi:hypothetical protein